MNKYLVITTLMFLSLASCSKEDGIAPEEEERSGISLDLVCSDPTIKTKNGKNGTKDGENPYNENTISTIDYFFYPLGSEDQNSVLHGRITATATGSYPANIPVDAAKVNVLYPGTARYCKVAVIINYPETIDHTSDENTKLEDIQNLPLSTDFKGSANSPIQDKFVMFGTVNVELDSKTKKLVNKPTTVEMRRVASKITLDLHVEPTVTTYLTKVTSDGQTLKIPQTWTPTISADDGSNMLFVYLQNALKKAVLSGDFSAVEISITDEDYFKYKQTEFTSNPVSHTTTVFEDDGEGHTVPVEKTFSYMVSLPFYTYPQTWEQSSPHEPFLKIVLPWTRQAGSYEYTEGGVTKTYSWGAKTKQFYYRVILPNNESGFESNNWYHIFMEVAVLGSETDDAQIDIEGKYFVQDWQDLDKSVSINDSRYLSVQQHDYIMYNTTELKIPYTSSHTCDKVIISATQYDFKNRTPKDLSADAASWFTFAKDADGKDYLVFNHDLDNDITHSGFDVAPYEITIKIQHPGTYASSFNEVINITQYPAMYIVQKQSTGYAFVNGVTGTATANSDYIWDDNGAEYTSSGGWNPTYTYYMNHNHFMGVVVGRNGVNGEGDNNNQYQYSIHVTVLPEGSSSSIGDPRIESGTTLSDLSASAGYRPTAENTHDIIAPVFKIASSYGKTSQVTYESGQKRCAAYQENGYPAGRWRLPTMAEIEYLINLSSKNKIPTLFGSEAGVGYWAAGGYFYVAKESKFINSADCDVTYKQGYIGDYNTIGRFATYTYNGTAYDVYTRCVYDEWYWRNDQDSAHMTTWGGFQTN